MSKIYKNSKRPYLEYILLSLVPWTAAQLLTCTEEDEGALYKNCIGENDDEYHPRKKTSDLVTKRNTLERSG